MSETNETPVEITPEPESTSQPVATQQTPEAPAEETPAEDAPAE